MFNDSAQFPPFDFKKATAEQMKDRISLYFQYCIDNDIRPGVEAMALAIGTTRRSICAWANGTDRLELQDTILKAKQVIAAYLEAISLSGQINPATSIFLLKNWFDYKDNTTTEIQIKPLRFGENMTNEEIENMIE